MAHKRDYKPEDIAFPNQVITTSDLVSEMQKSYIDYAMSVIIARALPDVRDGLKPVHRRILYTMYEGGLTSEKPFKKSATCVGDVLGITIRTVMHPYTMQWCALRRISPCAICWWTDTATLVRWTEILPQPTVIRKHAFPESQMRCSAISTKRR